MILELPIFFHTDSTQKLSNIDIDVPLNQCRIENICFFNINAISAYDEDFEGEKEARHSLIYCNNNSFICTLTKFEVISKIKLEMQKQLIGI
jgi:hypothetical protein